MNRLLISLLALHLAIIPARATTITPQVGGGLGNGFDGGISANGASAPSFFFATAGSDSNPCTQASPCQTVTKANTMAAGSIVKFNGGDTFATTTGVTANVSVTSYGIGQATISSGNSAPCVSQTNPALAVSINNIICTGGGVATNSTDAILFSNTGSSNLPGPSITNVTISQYGGTGVHIFGNSASCKGFNNTNVSGNTIHDVTGVAATSVITGAVVFNTATVCYGNGAQSPSHIGATVSANNIFNIPGAASSTHPSGNGIELAETSNGLVSGNTLKNIATANPTCGGSSGILLLDGHDITAQFNSVYDIDYAAGGCDSNGVDISDNLFNVTVQYNYVSNPGDHCFLLTNYSDSQHDFSNINVSWNVCQNPKYHAAVTTDIQITSAIGGSINIFNNTLVNQVPGNGAIFSNASSNTGSVTATVANNIFIGNANNLLSVAVPSSINFYGNDYYTYGQGLNISWNGSSYSSFAAWQTATGQEKIAGSNVGLTNNPSIYVPGGGWDIPSGSTASQLYAYYLQSGSPMAGAGINLQTQFGINPGTQDFYGATVSAASLPVGAAAGDFTTFTASCTASGNFLARVSSFTKADNVNYNSYLCGLNSDGQLSLMDLLYAPAAPNSAASLLNLLSSSFSLVSHGTTTFAAKSGILGDGSTGYLDTQWVPSTNGVNFTLASGSHAFCGQVAGISGSKADYGANFSTHGTAEASMWTDGGGWYADVNDNTGLFVGGTTATNGVFGIKRSSGVLTGYADGGSIGTATVAPVSAPDQNMIALAFNNGTGSGVVAQNFKAQRIACLMFGSGSINIPAFMLRSNSFLAAYGINQY